MQTQALAVLAQWDRECDSSCFLAFRLSLVSKHIPRPPGWFLQTSGFGRFQLPAFPSTMGFYTEYIVDRLSQQRIYCEPVQHSCSFNESTCHFHAGVSQDPCPSCRWSTSLPTTGLWWAIVKFDL